MITCRAGIGDTTSVRREFRKRSLPWMGLAGRFARNYTEANLRQRIELNRRLRMA
jgi:hypothetical protein